ncbi:hypothetical protein CEXT_506461 [Caerostris extrusa]|uniref:Uncharacterized protein n=1 Tax=Caerostris extrusa TaxID=172846 RepID=A0AAV4QNV1_CAEEX|nr:hypothetical protein CEXT_506461 [Caerostris extrusa]
MDRKTMLNPITHCSDGSKAMLNPITHCSDGSKTILNPITLCSDGSKTMFAMLNPIAHCSDGSKTILNPITHCSDGSKTISFRPVATPAEDRGEFLPECSRKSSVHPARNDENEGLVAIKELKEPFKKLGRLPGDGVIF